MSPTEIYLVDFKLDKCKDNVPEFQISVPDYVPENVKMANSINILLKKPLTKIDFSCFLVGNGCMCSCSCGW